MEESLLEKYKDELETSNEIGRTFAKLFCEMINIPLNRNVITMFYSLSKVYSRSEILLAMLDVYDMYVNEKLQMDANFYPLVSYLLKKRREKTKMYEVEDLTSSVQQKKKELKRQQKIKLEIRSPFDE